MPRLCRWINETFRSASRSEIRLLTADGNDVFPLRGPSDALLLNDSNEELQCKEVEATGMSGPARLVGGSNPSTWWLRTRSCQFCPREGVALTLLP